MQAKAPTSTCTSHYQMTTDNMNNILIVEDDLHLGFLLAELLEQEGYFVKLCKDGQMGYQAVKRQKFDCCILDIMMPNMDGFALAGKLHEEYPSLPFLFLTAKSRKADKLKGYQYGAEDYVLKPFDEDELLCKLKVILRRNLAPTFIQKTPKAFTIGRFQFRYDLQELNFEDESRRLTEKENEVLRLLCLHKGQILRRDEAVEQIYGKKDYFLGRSFDVFISRIRKMLSKDPNITIENVFKVGFILKISEE
jgi:DNA-binding response OmpR family regulator